MLCPTGAGFCCCGSAMLNAENLALREIVTWLAATKRADRNLITTTTKAKTKHAALEM